MAVDKGKHPVYSIQWKRRLHNPRFPIILILNMYIYVYIEEKIGEKYTKMLIRHL